MAPGALHAIWRLGVLGRSSSGGFWEDLGEVLERIAAWKSCMWQSFKVGRLIRCQLSELQRVRSTLKWPVRGSPADMSILKVKPL